MSELLGNHMSSFSDRLQRPHVYLPVHLYGQLVHHKTGCHLLESQVRIITIYSLKNFREYCNLFKIRFKRDAIQSLQK